MGLYFDTIKYAIQVFFTVNFLGFVDDPVMRIHGIVMLHMLPLLNHVSHDTHTNHVSHAKLVILHILL